jgi:hypothetical protein
MMTDTELRIKVLNILCQTIGNVDAERFIALIIREPFDYTVWQKDILNDINLEELSKRAMKHFKTE